jgi:hypothetical protein
VLILARSKNAVTNIVLGGHEQTIARARLGQYLVLEQLRRQPTTADTIRQYIKECGVPLTGDELGLELLRAYYHLVSLNKIEAKYPLFEARSQEKKHPWDYDTRWVLSWIHLIAEYYHWSRAEIIELDVDEAAGYIQEIVLTKQFESEWNYSLSPNSYIPDGKGNKKFEPLKRPTWMQEQQPEGTLPLGKKPTAIPKSMKPMGAIIPMGSLSKK